MAARQPILLHFASSDDVINLLPGNATRMQPPAGLCSGPNITWAARVGDMTYGEHVMLSRMLPGEKDCWQPMTCTAMLPGSLNSCLFASMPS
jgi:hypothetical protein